MLLEVAPLGRRHLEPKVLRQTSVLLANPGLASTRKVRWRGERQRKVPVAMSFRRSVSTWVKVGNVRSWKTSWWTGMRMMR